MSRLILGLSGLAGSGKTTVSDYLVDRHNFRRIKFAGPLKDMLRALGLNEREVEGDLKEKPCLLLGGLTPRVAMQLLGTEWGRDLIDADLWVRAWAHAVGTVPEGIPVVVDDLRFPNEANAIAGLSKLNKLIRIVRPGQATIATSGHVSELCSFPVNVVLDNNGTIEDLLLKVDRLYFDLATAFALSPFLALEP